MDPFVFNIYAVPFLVTAVLFLLFGVYVLVQAPRSLLHISFFWICISLFVWLGSTSAMLSANTQEWGRIGYKGLYFGVSFISVSIFTYSSVWLGYFKRQKKSVMLGILLGIFFTSAIWFTPWIAERVQRHSWGYYSRLTWWGGGAYLSFFGLYMFLLFRNFYRAFRETQNSLLKKQLRVILIGFFIAYIGAIDFLPCYGIDIFPIGAFTTLFLVCTLGYTVIRYKFLDIETVIHKTFMWFVTTVVAILPFTAAVYFTQDHLHNLSPLQMSAYFVVFSILFFFYFRALQPRLDHLFQRRRANLQTILEGFSKELVHLQNIRDLLQRFTRMLRKTLYTKQASVYLRDDTGQQFVPAIAKGLRGLKPFPVDHPFLRWLEKQDSVLLGNLAAADPEVLTFKKELEDYFKDVQAVLIVPFVLGGKLIGMAHLGKKYNLRHYRASEIHFLSQLKSSVTIAFSNSAQYESISDLYQKVQVQNRRLTELDRLKSEFLANTSHELRTPLSGILGLVESVLDGADGEVNNAQQKHLRMVLESGANLKELINNLLELSRIESGREPFNMKPFNVMNAIDAVLALLESMAKKKDLKLERVGPAVISDVYGDPEKIQRVLINLVGNAVKFTAKGKVTVTVEESEETLRIRVTDTGIGIPAEKQKIIFERFCQAEGGDTRRYEGTGLGLSIAREIVQLHGSEITVQSEPGRGSTFSFSLSKKPLPVPGKGPYSSAREALAGSALEEESTVVKEEKASSAEEDADFQELVRGNGETILIIDDNAVNREVIKTRLEMHHYKVQEAVDGLEGLRKILEIKPALVILDLMMPRMSGYELCKKLREKHTADEIPVIMLTAKTEMGDKIYGFSLGANDYISKPFNKEELIARVGALIRIRQMTHQLREWNAVLEAKVDVRTKELMKTQDQLVQAEKLATLGTLAGGVAHEINNPLTAVLTNAQILRMTADEDTRESLDLIEEGAKRCQGIVQKLMKYARKTVEETPHRDVDLRDVVKGTCALLGFQFQQENIEVEMKLGDVPPIQGIAGELDQVLTNLLVNARDAIFTAKVRGKIQVETRKTPEAIELVVTDNGIGISKENQKKIFDPFFTTKDVGSGTGLGLAVSFGILKRHNATIGVASSPGKGATFTVKFPLAAIPKA